MYKQCFMYVRTFVLFVNSQRHVGYACIFCRCDRISHTEKYICNVRCLGSINELWPKLSKLIQFQFNAIVSILIWAMLQNKFQTNIAKIVHLTYFVSVVHGEFQYEENVRWMHSSVKNVPTANCELEAFTSHFNCCERFSLVKETDRCLHLWLLLSTHFIFIFDLNCANFLFIA